MKESELEVGKEYWFDPDKNGDEGDMYVRRGRVEMGEIGPYDSLIHQEYPCGGGETQWYVSNAALSPVESADQVPTTNLELYREMERLHRQDRSLFDFMIQLIRSDG